MAPGPRSPNDAQLARPLVLTMLLTIAEWITWYASRLWLRILAVIDR